MVPKLPSSSEFEPSSPDVPLKLPPRTIEEADDEGEEEEAEAEDDDAEDEEYEEDNGDDDEKAGDLVSIKGEVGVPGVEEINFKGDEAFDLEGVEVEVEVEVAGKDSDNGEGGRSGSVRAARKTDS